MISGADSNNFEGPGPVERQFDFEDLGVSVGVARACALPNGRSGVVDPNPVVFDVDGTAKEKVRKGRILAFHLKNVEAVLFANDVVGAELAVSGEVAVYSSWS